MASLRRTGGAHIKFVREYRGRKTMRGQRAPRRMRFLVASEGDEAGLREREELLRPAPWTREEPFGGREAGRIPGMILLTNPGVHLCPDHLDRDLETSLH